MKNLKEMETDITTLQSEFNQIKQDEINALYNSSNTLSYKQKSEQTRERFSKMKDIENTIIEIEKKISKIKISDYYKENPSIEQLFINQTVMLLDDSYLYSIENIIITENNELGFILKDYEEFIIFSREDLTTRF